MNKNFDWLKKLKTIRFSNMFSFNRSSIYIWVSIFDINKFGRNTDLFPIIYPKNFSKNKQKKEKLLVSSIYGICENVKNSV